MIILGIETSCDETAASVVELRAPQRSRSSAPDEVRLQKGAHVLSSVIASQVDIHALTGGVVPEVASRAHVEQIISVIDKAFKDAEVTPRQIDAIAVTAYPGLIGSLLVGVNTAKSLALAWGKPLIPVNHLEGHIYANFISDKIRENTNYKTQNTNKLQIQNFNLNATPFEFPAIILLVSGGHTSLILMKDHGQYQTLGETLDDAAGEAFDKVARILGLGYPGGPSVSRYADEYRKKLHKTQTSQNTNKSQIQNPKLNTQHSTLNTGLTFPRPMLDSKDLNFSFSGLKTAVLYAWQRESGGRSSESVADGGATSAEARKGSFAYEFEEAATDVLVAKTIRAAQKYKAKTISIAGGVAANKRLREKMAITLGELRCPSSSGFDVGHPNLVLPPLKYCGDNATMVATCALFQLTKKPIKQLSKMNFEVASSKNL